MTTINSDVAPIDTEVGADNDGVDAFLARFLPPEEKDKKDAPKEPSEPTSKDKETEDAPQETEDEEETSDESPEDASETEETEEKAPEKKYVEDDQTYVKIKVGEEELEVPVGQLKRLHGQEVALTKRSQAVAEETKQVANHAQWHGTALEAMLQRAKARYEPFSKMDFFAIAADTTMKPEEKTALREMAQTAYEEVKFLEQSRNDFMTEVGKRQTAARDKAAAECVKQLSDQASPHYIEDWNEKTYTNLRNFAVENGMDKGVVNQLTDASAFKLLHMAMLYQQGQSARENIKTVKVNKTVKKVIKTSKTMPKAVRTGKGTDKAKSMERLQRTGDTDAAAEALLARWKDSDSE